ncbi:MAG: hypothetical protein JWO95_393 [Verrucomicrobiales bacterium]|nr:hypothetical protein [Verrucomicrobiales bacterium]
MEMLGEEANEEQLREARLQHRHKIMSRVRMWCGFLIFVGAIGYGYVYRGPLQDFVYDKCFKNDNGSGSVAETAARETLGGVQAQAGKRDSILNEIESKTAATPAVAEATAATK